MNNKKRNKYILIAMISLLVLLCGCGGTSEYDPNQEPEQGPIGNLTSFNGYTVKGNLYTNEMFADYDATIVYFWAPWSDAAVYELANVGAFAERLPDSVYFTTVCLDSDQGSPKKILSKADMSSVRTFINGDADLKTVSDQIVNVPTCLIVDGTGKVIAGPIIGVQENFADVYLKTLNQGLAAIGKAPVALSAEETGAEEDAAATTEAPAANTGGAKKSTKKAKKQEKVEEEVEAEDQEAEEEEQEVEVEEQGAEEQAPLN